jgi:hypothetical protein
MFGWAVGAMAGSVCDSCCFILVSYQIDGDLDVRKTYLGDAIVVCLLVVVCRN